MNEELIEGQNTGIHPEPVLPSAFTTTAGQLEQSAINPNGDWKAYAPPGEWQKLKGINAPQNGFNTGGVDFLNCVSFGFNDAVETYMDYQIAHGAYPVENIAWLHANGYFNPDGTLNFSDRALAKGSGTTTDGNWTPRVAEYARLNGLVPESLWPMPVAEITANPAQYWEIYYRDLPPEVLAMGQEFLKRFTLAYEQITDTSDTGLHAALSTSPLTVATAVCQNWNNGISVRGCGDGSQHETCLLSVGPDGTRSILDHYEPFIKTLAPEYKITWAWGIRVYPKTAPVISPSKPVFNRDLHIGMVGEDVRALQKILNTSGYPVTLTGAGSAGQESTYFGSKTQVALIRYQRAHSITPAIGYFGAKTRAVINSTTAGTVYNVGMNSPQYSLNFKDLAKGLLVAVFAAIIASIGQALNAPGFDFATFNYSQLLSVALTAGIGYLTKNFLTDSSGKIAGIG